LIIVAMCLRLAEVIGSRRRVILISNKVSAFSLRAHHLKDWRSSPNERDKAQAAALIELRLIPAGFNLKDWRSSPERERQGAGGGLDRAKIDPQKQE
jgi:hypothetical protein